MGFLRRFLVGDRGPGSGTDEADAADADPDDETDEPVDLDEEERAHELELARFEQARSDDLIRRQQRYADRSWTPPPQGGERRAEDGDASGS
jgi:hypothetical protein